jgi:hypothetical protein
MTGNPFKIVARQFKRSAVYDILGFTAKKDLLDARSTHSDEQEISLYYDAVQGIFNWIDDETDFGTKPLSDIPGAANIMEQSLLEAKIKGAQIGEKIYRSESNPNPNKYLLIRKFHEDPEFMGNMYRLYKKIILPEIEKFQWRRIGEYLSS